MISTPRTPALEGRARQWAGLARRQGDLALAGLLVTVVALFVLPVPTALLDLLIATNLALSLVLLIVAMYAPSALSMSTFPSLLLFTTLFRLALNIASTKLILLHADAGAIIDTFGRLIVGNNVVVGGVVFLIIAIVQFIVIAKGSERVAEVAARFALDAMPGKQMSIDADVRAGVLSAAQAQARRRVLEQECQLHGAMDGAMKFVKGDAIAGLVIALVNILAGVAIGTLMLGMSMGMALQTFATLTVGDGMVSQIPSLLVSIAAGVVITRVPDASADAAAPQLASQIARQVLAHPRALLVAGAALASFLLVPGFPKWAFGLLALGTLTIGLVVRGARGRRHVSDWITHPHGATAGAAADADGALASPLAVVVPDLGDAGLDLNQLDLRLDQVKLALQSELGPVFPRMRILRHAPPAAADRYRILVQDVPVAEGPCRPGWLMLDPSATDLPPAAAEVGAPFGPFERVVWVPAAAGLAGLAPADVIAAHVTQVVRRHAPELIGLQEVQRLLHAVQREWPDLVAEATRTVPMARIVEVLRRLLQEGLPIRSMNLILECLVTWSPREQDTVALTELVRAALGRYITCRHVGPDRRLPAILFEASLLDRVVAAIQPGLGGNHLLLSPAAAQDIRDQARHIADSSTGKVVAITSAGTRRCLKTLLEPALPELAVLSYQELDADVALQPVGWIANPKAA